MIYLLCGYMWLFIHRPFEVWPVLATLRIERVYVIFTLLCWLAVAHKRWTRNPLNLGFALLALAILASAAFAPLGSFESRTVQDWFKVAVFYALVLTTVRDEKDFKTLVAAFAVCFGLYMAHSFREFLCGRHVYRMGVRRMIGVDRSFNDPNTFGASVLYSLPMIYPLWFEFRKRWQRLALAGYVVLAVTCILLTGSRSAFVGLLTLGLIVTMLSPHRVKIALALALAAPLVWANLRPDLKNRYLTLIDPSYGPSNAQTSAEGRKEGWRDGVRLWKEHPIFGVGPGAFGLATGKGMQAHHLYGQVLGELGTLGAIGLGAVVWAFFGNALALRRLGRQEPELARGFPAAVAHAVAVTVLLLLFMALGGHNLYRYTWLWYGAFQAVALSCLAQQAARPQATEPACDLSGDSLAIAEPWLPTARASAGSKAKPQRQDRWTF